MSRDDYDALEETAHLLRSPANVRRLLESTRNRQSRNPFVIDSPECGHDASTKSTD